MPDTLSYWLKVSSYLKLALAERLQSAWLLFAELLIEPAGGLAAGEVEQVGAAQASALTPGSLTADWGQTTLLASAHSTCSQLTACQRGICRGPSS